MTIQVIRSLCILLRTSVMDYTDDEFATDISSTFSTDSEEEEEETLGVAKVRIPTPLKNGGTEDEKSRDLVEFAMALSESLRRNGLTSVTVEDGAQKVGRNFDVAVRVFAVPTATIFAFGDEDRYDRVSLVGFSSESNERRVVFYRKRLIY